MLMYQQRRIFYTGYGDILVCAYFGLNLYKWNTEDIPLIEHAKYNKNCAYISLSQSDIIRLTKKSNLIEKVKSLFNNLKDLLFIVLYKINLLQNTFFYYVNRTLISITLTIGVRFVLIMLQLYQFYRVVIYLLVFRVLLVYFIVQFVDVISKLQLKYIFLE